MIAPLLLNSDLIVVEGIARHRVIGALNHNAEAFAGRRARILLHVAAHRIVAHHNASRHIHIARWIASDERTAEDGNTRMVADVHRGRGRDGDGVTFHHNTAIARIEARAVRVLDLNTKATIIGHVVVADNVRASTGGQTDGRHAAVTIADHRIAAHRHARSCAIL